ncbi:pyrimidine reductase family protein [Parasphingorhabdus pacifica]
MDGTQQVDSELEAFYDFPEHARPWLRVNFVSSLDGAVTVGGRSRGLSSRADQRVLGLIRDLSDVVLAGIGTATVEGYRGIKPTEARNARRTRFGLSEQPPPIALVTRRCSLTPDAPLVTDTHVAPIVLTCEAAPVERRRALADAGVDVVVTGDEDVDLHEAVSALDRRGLGRIGCEGGPTLFGKLIEQDLVDELCLTVSPMLAGGDAGRIATGTPIEQPRGMRLVSALRAEESLLLLRYARMRG